MEAPSPPQQFGVGSCNHTFGKRSQSPLAARSTSSTTHLMPGLRPGTRYGEKLGSECYCVRGRPNDVSRSLEIAL